jgi:hypothetical protein
MIFALTVNFDLALAYALYPEHTQELNKQRKRKKKKNKQTLMLWLEGLLFSSRQLQSPVEEPTQGKGK